MSTIGSIVAVYKCPHHGCWVDSEREEGCPACLAEGGARAKHAKKRNNAPPMVGGGKRNEKARRRKGWLWHVLLLLAGALLLTLPSVQSLLREQGLSEVAERAEQVSSRAKSLAGEVHDTAESAASTLASKTPDAPPGARVRFALPAKRVDLLTTHTAGKSGFAWLPPRDPNEPRPLLVWLHPAGHDGREAIERLKPLAERHRFAVVAPTSHRGGGAPGSFQVWDTGQGRSFSDDDHHILDCVSELLESGRFTLDGDRVLLLGVAGGGQSALRLATWKTRFSHFAVVHEAPRLTALGRRKPPGYIAAGTQDTVRTESRVRLAFEQLRGLGYPIRLGVSEAGHAVSDAELSAIVAWWLSVAP